MSGQRMTESQFWLETFHVFAKKIDANTCLEVHADAAVAAADKALVAARSRFVLSSDSVLLPEPDSTDEQDNRSEAHVDLWETG